jgi:cytochrome c556
MRAFPLTPGLLCAALFLTAALSSTCSPSSRPLTDAKSTAANAPPVQAPALWGDVKPVVSVKELMRDLIDPIVFEAVSVVVTKGGEQEKVPKTDEDWQRIRTGAVGIAEGAELLRIRRPFAPAGDLNNSTGPDPAELSPAQITAKVEKDPVEWNARAEAMRNVGLQVIDIVKRKDVQELWDAAENLEEACENCHRSYWYPGENAQFYEKLNRRLEQLRAK